MMDRNIFARNEETLAFIPGLEQAERGCPFVPNVTRGHDEFQYIMGLEKKELTDVSLPTLLNWLGDTSLRHTVWQFQLEDMVKLLAHWESVNDREDLYFRCPYPTDPAIFWEPLWNNDGEAHEISIGLNRGSSRGEGTYNLALVGGGVSGGYRVANAAYHSRGQDRPIVTLKKFWVSHRTAL